MLSETEHIFIEPLFTEGFELGGATPDKRFLVVCPKMGSAKVAGQLN